MRKYILFCYCLLINNLCKAQQSFINVPSGELTPAKKLFFQQQLNINELFQSNTTIDFGLGKGFESGINVLGLNYNRESFFIKNDTNDRDPYNPLITFNSMKHFKLNQKIFLAMGIQYGVNFIKGKTFSEAGLIYSNLQLKNLMTSKSNIVVGAYYNTLHYGGTGNRTGVWIGMEFETFSKLHFLAESICGNNALSYTSVGVVYYPTPRLPLSLAMQIPNTARNAYALVFELTILPKPHE